MPIVPIAGDPDIDNPDARRFFESLQNLPSNAAAVRAAMAEHLTPRVSVPGTHEVPLVDPMSGERDRNQASWTDEELAQLQQLANQSFYSRDATENEDYAQSMNVFNQFAKVPFNRAALARFPMSDNIIDRRNGEE